MTPKPQEKLFKKTYAKTLLKIADGDLASAQALHQIGKGRPENVCFLAQQSVEKSLKAVLCHFQIPFPLIHELGALVAKMPEGVEPPGNYELNALNPFATNRRYEEHAGELTSDEIKEILKIALQVAQWARKIISV